MFCFLIQLLDLFFTDYSQQGNHGISILDWHRPNQELPWVSKPMIRLNVTSFEYSWYAPSSNYCYYYFNLASMGRTEEGERIRQSFAFVVVCFCFWEVPKMNE